MRSSFALLAIAATEPGQLEMTALSAARVFSLDSIHRRKLFTEGTPAPLCPHKQLPVFAVWMYESQEACWSTDLNFDSDKHVLLRQTRSPLTASGYRVYYYSGGTEVAILYVDLQLQ